MPLTSEQEMIDCTKKSADWLKITSCNLRQNMS